jgi:hypothetical protein
MYLIVAKPAEKETGGTRRSRRLREERYFCH